MRDVKVRGEEERVETDEVKRGSPWETGNHKTTMDPHRGLVESECERRAGRSRAGRRAGGLLVRAVVTLASLRS